MATRSVIEVGVHCCGCVELFGVLGRSVAFVTAFRVGMVACRKSFPQILRPFLQIGVSVGLISDVQLN
jgi:hypothetical protein